MAHLDPNHRRQAYHASPHTALSAQAKRRQTALDAQKQRRVHAVEAARDPSFRSLDLMDGLSLDGASASDSDADSDAVPASLPPTAPPAVDEAGAPAPVIAKTKRKAFKPKYKPWARNLLSYAETLDLRHSLPEGLESDWRAVVVPKGKRALCATTTDTVNGNTILYSRVAGRTLARHRTVLPPDSLLDVVWDAAQSVLWVLDICKWRGQYLVDCDAEFRAFFLTSKLSELPTQPYIPPSSSPASPSPSSRTRPPSSHPLLVLPAPSYAPPLTPAVLLPLLVSLSAPSAMPVRVLAPSPSSPSSTPSASPPAFAPTDLSIPLGPTGLLLYLSTAHYPSGPTPLVGWVPLSSAVEAEARQAEGTERMAELVREWEGRGGAAAMGRQEEMREDGMGGEAQGEVGMES
ncbi:hypothetical protein JCM10207_001360 [Rhodosporidiobolus poonsookiae]